MAVNLSFIGGAGWQFFDDNGVPLSGGKIFTYAAGTTTPQSTFTSRSGTTPNTNPIILDAAGRTPAQIWATEGLLYKYVIKTSTDTLIRTWDDIGGSVVASDLAQDLANTTNNAKGDALIGFRQSNAAGFLANAVGRTVNDKLQEIISLKDFGAVGDGIADDTVAIQSAINAAANGEWVDGGNASYKITSSITGTNANVRLRNLNLIFGDTYTTQGNFLLDASASAATISLENISVNGGRGTYKSGLEPWEVFSSFGGYSSIRPALPPVFRIEAYNVNSIITVKNVNFYNVHANSCLQINTYGTVFIDSCEYENISNQTFHVYHSPDDGVTQNGRTFVSDVYAQDIGLLPANYMVSGLAKTRSDPYAPQASFNFIVSHGEYTLNNASVWNYGSCAVTADRNRVFTASNISIYSTSTTAFSNNPSGAFFLENCRNTNVSNLFVEVTARDPRDTALDSSLLQIFTRQDGQTNFNNVVLLTNPLTPAVRKIIRGALFGNPHVTISNFYCAGLTSVPTATVDISVLPDAVIGHHVKLISGYVADGDIRVEQPLDLVVDNVWCAASTTGGNITTPPSGNPGVTGTPENIVISNCRLAGGYASTLTVSGALKVINNKSIAGSVACNVVTGYADVRGNTYIGGGVTVSSGASTTGTVNISDNSNIVGVTTLIAAKNASISGNNTNRRIEIKDVQTFQVNGNTAKTALPESIIWVNPATAANVLAGVISSNNVLIKTGTVGAGYVTIAGGVSGVTDVNNNKLTVAWS